MLREITCRKIIFEKMNLCIFLLVFLHQCHILCVVAEAPINDKIKRMETMKSSWNTLAFDSYDKNRNKTVHDVLSKISGIYHDKRKIINTRLEKTVLINVVEATDNERGNDKYKHYLKNLLCFAKTYDFESVVYIIEPNIAKYKQEADELSQFYKNVYSLPYPYELFWKLIAQKESKIHYEGHGKADYLGNIPTFKHFGALVMLVPILEALQLGYNVIFFDVDVALVRDPLPYMILGDADFVTSLELKVCTFPSLIPTTEWDWQEPNTGTMHVRSTPTGVKYFTSWLSRLVEDNTLNDQRAMMLYRETNAKRVNTCDLNNQHLNMGEDNSINITNNSSIAIVPRVDQFQYCFLNEFLFQNGLMEFYCSKGKRQSSVSAYVLGMKRKALHSSLYNENGELVSGMSGLNGGNYSTNNNSIDRYSSSGYSGSGGGAKHHYYTPATLHVNFCVTKHKGLDDRGLWLYSQTTNKYNVTSEKCLPYNIHKTHFVKGVEWTERIKTAENELYNAINSMDSTTSQLVKFPKLGNVYLYENKSLHLIPNKATFLARGYDFSKVKTLKGSIFTLLEYGSDIPSME